MSATRGGFDYNARRKRAHFSVYAKGSKGRRRRERTLSVSSIEEAREAYSAFCREIDQEFADEQRRRGGQPEGGEGDSAKGRTTFQEFIRAELPRIVKDLRETTKKSYKSIVRARLVPAIGGVSLDRIDSNIVDGLVDRFHAENLSNAYINCCLRVLRLLVNQSVRRGYLASTPLDSSISMVKVRLPALELTETERERFFAAFDNREKFLRDLERRQPKGRAVTIDQTGRSPANLGTRRRYGHGLRSDSQAAEKLFQRFCSSKELFLVAIQTGLRKSDLLALQWDEVDLGARWIRVETRKTNDKVSIPITDVCLDALSELSKRPRSSWVFVDHSGKRFSWSAVRRYFAIAKRLAGFGKARRLRFHDLRHSYACMLVGLGVPLAVISKSMGHSSIRMTERYARVGDDAMKQQILAATSKG